MQNNDKVCHGQVDGMAPCSEHLQFSHSYKLWWRIRLAVIHLRWHFQEKGLAGIIRHSFSKLTGTSGTDSNRLSADEAGPRQTRDDEVLNLKPGEWVEVKSEKEILAMLDEKGTYKGLRWMCNMRKFCGKKFRVYKRLEKMLLESKQEYRQVKNTVLLEDAICDGEEWFGCDRSCYHFWREVWLRRTEQPDYSVKQ